MKNKKIASLLILALCVGTANAVVVKPLSKSTRGTSTQTSTTSQPMVQNGTNAASEDESKKETAQPAPVSTMNPVSMPSDINQVVVPVPTGPTVTGMPYTWNRGSQSYHNEIGIRNENNGTSPYFSAPPTDLSNRLPLARQLEARGLSKNKVNFEAKRLSTEEFDLWSTRLFDSYLPE